MTVSRLVVILAIGIGMTSTLALAQTSPAAATVTVSNMSRWGAAASQLDGLLLVHGGKATTNAGYTYTSAPDSSDLLILNLSTPFPLSAPPWQSLSTPATASFHTLSPLSRTSFALFGGQDNLSPTPSANDSLYVLDMTDPINPQWTAEVAAHPEWNQPLRRMLHAAPSDPIAQSLYLLGGERADGSGISTQELWTFSPSATSFSQVLPPPTTNIIDGAAPLLADGTIVLVGGLTGPASLAPMNSITSYNPRSQTWSTTAVASANGNASYPAPRRAHVAVPLPDNRIFVHGGASADLSTPLADAWVLDWAQSPPLWSPIQSLSNTAAASGSAPDARFAHSAVSYGNNILLAFGWTGNNAAETSLWVWDGTQASMDAGGNTVGGFWIGSSNSEATSGGVGSVPSYTPDPNAQPLSNGLGWSPSSNSPSGGSKGPSGNSPSQTGSGQPSSTNKPRPSSSGPTKPGGSENKDDSTSAGAKAGIILGMLMGLGLAGGAGYYAYRAYQAHTHPSYHRGAGYGKAGLLLGNNSGDGYDDREEDDAFTRKRSGTGTGGGHGGMWGTGAAAVGGFLSSSLAGRKRGRDEMGDHEALMLEKGRYQHLANLPSSYPSPTGAVLGSPALTDSSSAARAALANRGRGLAVGERGLPPVGPRGPKALSRTEHYTNAVEAAEQQMMRNLREEEVSETSMGAGGVIPMAGASGAAAGGGLAAANAGVRAGVRDKIARLVGGGRSQAGPDGMEGYHASETGAAGGAGAALGAAAGAAGGAGGRGGGGAGGYGPRRLDILADEDADEEALRRKYPRQYGAARAMVNPFADRRAGRSGAGGVDEEEEEEDEANRLLVGEDEDEYLDAPRRGGGRGGGVAGPRGMYAEPEYRIRPSMEDEADGYVVSPFEDDAAVVSNARPFRGAALAMGAQRDSVESSHSADAVRRSQILQHPHQQQPALFSNIINMPPSTSAGMNVAWVDGGVGGGGGGGGAGPAGDHAAPGGGGAEMMGAGPDREDGARSPFIRRSGTWWDRFMATSFLDRSSSGAIKAPTAVDPIRDPRRFNESIASLGTLAESVDGGRQGEGDVSAQTAYYNPFGDEYGAGVEQQQQQQRSSRPKLGRLNSALEGGGNPFVSASAAAAASGTDTPSTSTHTDSMYAHTTTSATTVLTSTASASTSATTHSSHHGYPAIVAPPAPALVTSKSTRVRTRSNSPTRNMSTSSRTHAPRTTNAQKLGRSLHKPASLSSLSTTGNGSIFTSNGSEGGGAGGGGVSGDGVLRGPSGRVRRTIAMLGGANAHLFVANPDREGSMRSSEGGA